MTIMENMRYGSPFIKKEWSSKFAMAIEIQLEASRKRIG